MSTSKRSQFDLPDQIFQIVRKARGIGNLARSLGIRPQSICKWTRVPEHHLDTIHRLYGFHPMELRPDVFDPERLKKKQEWAADNQSRGPRRRRYKYKRSKPDQVEMAWLHDEKPIAYTPRGRKLAGLP